MRRIALTKGNDSLCDFVWSVVYQYAVAKMKIFLGSRVIFGFINCDVASPKIVSNANFIRFRSISEKRAVQHAHTHTEFNSFDFQISALSRARAHA